MDCERIIAELKEKSGYAEWHKKERIEGVWNNRKAH